MPSERKIKKGHQSKVIIDANGNQVVQPTMSFPFSAF